MSDSSSVDRWHPSNVEWPTKDRKIKPGPKQVVLQVSGGGFDSYSGFQFAMPSDAYEALFADRGRVLAAIEKRVEGLRLVPPNVGYGDGWQDYNSAIDDALAAIKSSSSDINQERDH